jgi:predicted tellurium resistance membrane protein TerC
MEDMKINVKIRLSLMWVALEFCYLYNDVISFFRADHAEAILAGELAGIQITQSFLFPMAVLMSLPMIMTFLSLSLPAKANRRVNLIVGIFHAVVMVASSLLVQAEIWSYYAYFMALESVFIVLIIWTAWKWPKQEA